MTLEDLLKLYPQKNIVKCGLIGSQSALLSCVRLLKRKDITKERALKIITKSIKLLEEDLKKL